MPQTAVSITFFTNSKRNKIKGTITMPDIIKGIICKGIGVKGNLNQPIQNPNFFLKYLSYIPAPGRTKKFLTSKKAIQNKKLITRFHKWLMQNKACASTIL